jgi:hypothetical protein
MKIKEVDGFDVHFDTLPEDVSLTELFDPDYEGLEEIKEQIRTGELQYFTAKISVWKAGIELSSEYLGGCIREDENEFWKEPDSYFPQMLEQALKNAKAYLPELIKNLSE